MSAIKTIQFYQLLSTPLHIALGALISKAYDAGFHLCITVNQDFQQELSNTLWQQSGAMFLANCLENESLSQHHPIIISNQPIKDNQANILIITNMLEYNNSMPEYEKILFIFDGNLKHELENARILWKKYQKQDYQLIYFKQQNGGGWQKNE